MSAVPGFRQPPQQRRGLGVKIIRPSLAAIALAVLASMLSIWYYPSENDYTGSNAAWNGISDFNQRFATVTVDNLDDLLELPADATLVAIPVIDYSPAELGQFIP